MLGLRRDRRAIAASLLVCFMYGASVWGLLPIERGVSECRFEVRGAAATSPVVLGEKHDDALLGAVTLETLGFMLNPLTREILPMRMALSRLRSSR